jgi:rhodanese-related sulfurtransferase
MHQRHHSIFSLLAGALLVACGSSAPSTDASTQDLDTAIADQADTTTAIDTATVLTVDANAIDAGSALDATAADTGYSVTGCIGWTTLVRLSPAEVSDLVAKTDPIVIDVHYPYYGDIPGTDTSIHYDNVDAIEAYLHKDHCTDVILVCESGGMSQMAGNELVKRGYLRVRDLKGGMLEWEKAGYPLLKDGGT